MINQEKKERLKRNYVPYNNQPLSGWVIWSTHNHPSFLKEFFEDESLNNINDLSSEQIKELNELVLELQNEELNIKAAE